MSLVKELCWPSAKMCEGHCNSVFQDLNNQIRSLNWWEVELCFFVSSLSAKLHLIPDCGSSYCWQDTSIRTISLWPIFTTNLFKDKTKGLSQYAWWRTSTKNCDCLCLVSDQSLKMLFSEDVWTLFKMSYNFVPSYNKITKRGTKINI